MTPKRRTPMVRRGRLHQHRSDQDRDREFVNVTDEDIERKEKETIELYRMENQKLLRLKNDAMALKKITGVEVIDKGDGTFLIEQCVTVGGKQKWVKYEIREEDEDGYRYKLVDTNMGEMPEMFTRELGFDKAEIYKFYHRMLGTLLSKP